MANYQVLKNSIMQVIKQNGNEEITGDLLQQTLIAMVNTIGNGYNFKGLVQSSSPTPSDTNVFYIVNTPGEYTNYGPNMRVLPNEIAIFKYDGQWHKDLVLNDRFVDFSTAQIINNIKTFVVGLNAPFYAITDTEQGITLDAALDAKADEAIVATILALIPAQATPQNQLADKDFVNASISSNTANFIGTFDSLEELEEYPTAGLTNNDYAFVISTDSQGNVVYKRYKWVANSDAWLFEYDLNNSSFTAAQWAAINSGITQGNWDYVLSLVQQWVDIIPDDATAQNPLVTRQYLKDRHIILPLLTQEATQAQLQEVYNAIMGAPNDAAFFLTLPDNRGIMPLAVAKGGTMAFAQYADGRFSHELKITLANNVYILEKTDREFATSDLYYDKTTVDAKFMELLDGLENGLIIPALAENLNSPDGVTEQTPFIFRTTGGATSITSGFAEIKALKGNSVVWNQHIKNAKLVNNLQDWESRKSYDIMDGFTRFHNVDGSIWLYPIGLEAKMSHTYLWSVRVRASVSGESGQLSMFFGVDEYVTTPFTDSFATYNILKKSNVGGQIGFSVYPNPQSGDMDIAFITITDLTQMFGAGNEPSTYEEFIARKPLVADEYAYNPGEIISVDVDKIKTVGFNAYNHTTGIARVLGGKEYEIVGAYDSLTLGGETIVPVNGKFTPSVDGDLVVTGGNVNTTCVHLVWSGYRNGEYRPYESHELDLSWYKQIRKSDGTLLFEDGKLRSAGTPCDIVTETQATKRIGIKVFDGTEDWSGSDTIKYIYLTDLMGISKDDGGLTCNLYGPAINWSYMYNNDKSVSKIDAMQNNLWYVHDNDYTVDAWKSHLAELYAQGNPFTIYYELADPIVVDYDEKVMNYRVDDFGTEEFIVNDGVTAPVAHTIIYKTNLRDEIRNLPKNYQSQTSMDNALNAIAAALNLTITKTWNDTTKAYQYTVTQNVETAMMPPIEH